MWTHFIPLLCGIVLCACETDTPVGPSTGEVLSIDLPGGESLEFAWIAPGHFTMGTTREQEEFLRGIGLWDDGSLGMEHNGGILDGSDEQPAHAVVIRRGFWLGTTEVTRAQWEDVVGSHVWPAPDRDDGQFGEYPAVMISWLEAHEFLHALNHAAGDSLYRLPTEAEWEYACRAGTQTPWSFGDDKAQLDDHAWYRETADGARPVATRLPNPWGLYDMHGNVQEWCQDYYGSYSEKLQIDPCRHTQATLPGTDHRITFRVWRGGDFGNTPRGARSASRRYQSPGAGLTIAGFRVVRMATD